MKKIKLIFVVCIAMFSSDLYAQNEILMLQMQMNQQQAEFNRRNQQFRQQMDKNGFDLDHSSINGVPAKSLPDDGTYTPRKDSGSRLKSTSGGFTRAQINHQADVEARAYEYYQKNPNRQNHDYWQSPKKMTQFMQQHYNGR